MSLILNILNILYIKYKLETRKSRGVIFRTDVKPQSEGRGSDQTLRQREQILLSSDFLFFWGPQEIG